LENDADRTHSTGEPAEIDERLMRSYAPDLDGRAFTVAFVPIPGNRPRIALLSARVRTFLEFRIALKTGGTLIVDNKSPVAISPLGLPVGLGAGIFGTLVALVALITMYRETRPLTQLARAVDRIDLAGVPISLPRVRSGAGEIQALIAAFDRLQTRLSQLLRSRMAMLGGISHDVRTFATRLRLRVDLIPEGAERDRAISDISDMIRLLDDALLASRAGAGELAEELLEFDELVRGEVEDRRAAGAMIDVHIDENTVGATVLGDRLALRRVVSNLADNALKYGGIAHLSLRAKQERLVLTVDDEGAGIPPELRDVLLEPFVRIETSRSRNTGGAGLGLAIVRNLIEAHDGTVTIGDAPKGGARITVELPLFVAT
jgi:signal transduction histidine kinase